MPINFWSYAFHHVIRIRNAIPGRGQEHSPFEMIYNKKENFKNLRTFGCRAWVRPPGIQSRQFKDKSRKGIFLGYLPHTVRNVIYYNEDSMRVKIANHCRFDEGYNDLPAESLPPNAKHILRINDGKQIEMDARELDSNDFLFHIHPFLQVQDITLKVPAATKSQTFGLKLMEDDL